MKVCSSMLLPLPYPLLLLTAAAELLLLAAYLLLDWYWLKEAWLSLLW